MPYFLRALMLACICFPLAAIAGDLSSEVRKGASGPDSSNGGYLEVGGGLKVFTSPFYGAPEGNEQGEVHAEAFIDISARYQYNGWFVEMFSQSLEQFSAGYNFYNGDNWAVDLVGLSDHDEMDEDASKDYRGLNRRRFDVLLGPRGTAYLGNYILQVHALKDIVSTHEGEVYSIKLARHWQHRNLNFHAIVGATYRTQEVMDYYYSIDADEASEKFPEFTASGGMSYIVELGATYPISESWVFRGFIRRTQIDSALTKSPLIVDDHGEMIATAISYVF
ncbi:MAG: MipA/OmpV family protein [Cellvibrio sp.]|uniref:MipA/OmpV family protein n=1 Tax=Cellvibrio sp. TaxID=1965322 RepID=UPI0031A7314E